MPPKTNDQWLAELQADGAVRDAALTELRDRLVTGLRYGLRNYLTPSDPGYLSLVEEAVQEALLKILDNVASFRGQSRFTTWAQKITLNTALTELRRKRWQDYSLNDMLERDGSGATADLLADTAGDPEQMALQADLLRRVQRIIAEELTERQRTALVAVHVRGAPVDEVACRLGMQRNALYKLVHDARLKLRKQLEQEGLAVEEILAAFDE